MHRINEEKQFSKISGRRWGCKTLNPVIFDLEAGVTLDIEIGTSISSKMLKKPKTTFSLRFSRKFNTYLSDDDTIRFENDFGGVAPE